MVVATTSGRTMPAVVSARRIAGPRASRCAREAISGTTPPNRTCSSTLEATSSANRVKVPSASSRVIPTPVSSQEVSMAKMIVPGIYRAPPGSLRIVYASAPLTR